MHDVLRPAPETFLALSNRDAASARLLVTDDVGSAIGLPARGGVSVGSGAAAGSVAGRICHKGGLIVLAPLGRAGG